MHRIALPVVLIATLLVSFGCSGPQSVGWVPPPIPARPILSSVMPVPPPVAKATPPPAAPARDLNLNVAVVPRSSWSPMPPIVSRMDPMGKPLCITVHHEGQIFPTANAAEVKDHLYKMSLTQQKPKSEGGLGSGDIAYHFLIDNSGTIYEGRDLKWQGAHAGNNDANHGNIGICLLGDFDTKPPTPAQKDSLRRLMASLMKRYDIPSTKIYTHCEVKRMYGLPATDCPGKYLQAYVDSLRSDLKTARR